MVITTTKFETNWQASAKPSAVRPMCDSSLFRFTLPESNRVVTSGVDISVRSLAPNNVSVQGTGVSTVRSERKAVKNVSRHQSLTTISIAVSQYLGKPSGSVAGVAGATSGTPPRGRPV